MKKQDLNRILELAGIPLRENENMSGSYTTTSHDATLKNLPTPVLSEELVYDFYLLQYTNIMPHKPDDFEYYYKQFLQEIAENIVNQYKILLIGQLMKYRQRDKNVENIDLRRLRLPDEELTLLNPSTKISDIPLETIQRMMQHTFRSQRHIEENEIENYSKEAENTLWRILADHVVKLNNVKNLIKLDPEKAVKSIDRIFNATHNGNEKIFIKFMTNRELLKAFNVCHEAKNALDYITKASRPVKDALKYFIKKERGKEGGSITAQFR